ncbi:aminotransferase class I/II-fold pyridoxal phosphate-dependent enzyme [Pirellulimonas nuda]|uniref:aminotransferase class I/II-fold pyridoxal phosphate-dependent enzyme n=1 Tax=Pirellulimonas nuda TaxID=2528009 RepID=UPI0018D2FF42|nr:aminotransferase class I/II-fold pyridoxal phosphate-dependent enzyme [Pirellulimonas nuda]
MTWQGFEPLTIPSDAPDLVSLLRERATRYPGERAFTFLVDGETQRQHINYGQLDAKARAVATELQGRNLAGERALLLYPSGLDFIAAFFGCLYAGVVAVPAYPPRRNRNLTRIQSILKDASPKVALTTAEAWARIEPMIHDQPALLDVPWISTDKLDVSIGDKWRRTRVTPDTLAFLQYTSGSTGTPKGVMLSHGNLLSNTKYISDAFKPTTSGQGVTWLPLYHDMGLIGGVIQPIYFARPNTLMTPTHFLQKPLRWLKAVSDTGAVISGGPNFAYELAAERISDEEAATLDLSQWSVAFNGAEPVRAETMEKFSRKFAVAGFQSRGFLTCYGLAESTLMVTASDKYSEPVVRSYDAEAMKQGVARSMADSTGGAALTVVSSGVTSTGQRVAIVDPETHEEQPERIVGEVWVAGPSVAQGYWRRDELSRETFAATTASGRGPFLRTGDLGFLDGDELFISGRLKDLIIINGANHYPQDLELTVEHAHPYLPPSSGAAFTVGEDGREKLVLVHEAGRDRRIDIEEVFTAVRKAISEMHDVAPAAIVLIKPNSIPKTSSGKIQRHACRQAYLDGTLSVSAEWSATGGVTVHGRRRAAADADATEPTPPAPPAATADTNGQPPRKAPAATERTDIVDRVLATVRAVAKERSAGLTLDSDIPSLGLDSLERMEIVAALEDDFGGRFPEEAILGMETCRDVVRAVEQHLVSPDATKPTARQVLPGDYNFAESPEYQRLAESIRMAEGAGFGNPYFTVHEGLTNDTALIGGREYINFSSFNYLGMSGDPAVATATKAAVDRFGTSVSASRLVSGEKTIHLELEQLISKTLHAEDAIAMVGGHATNETVIGHLFGPGDLVLHDSLAHNSIVQGARLSGALRRAFPHNDHQACAELLERYRGEYRRVLIAVEGVYSMDGDFCDIRKFVELKNEHQCNLYVDEAHSLGTMGERGLGMSEYADLSPGDVDIWMGTLSKGLGSSGGYIAGSAEMIRYLKYTAPGFVFSTGLSPPDTAAALKALQLLLAEPQRVERLRRNSELFLSLAKQAGLNTGMSGGTPIVPIITGNSILAIRLSRMMFARGVNVQPILHPAVEEERARLRFFINALHTEDQIRQAAALLVECYEEATGESAGRASKAATASATAR